MNLPNKMTLLRIILIPVFMVVLYWGFPGATWVALAIFIIASLTDMLDGKIARKYNLVTDFGKFADPLADKMLVTAAMLWFVEIGQMPAWMLLIVICREFAVSGLRMIASDKGRVIAAGWSGKVKTASTMVCIVIMFLPIPGLDNREFVKTAIEVLRGRTLYGKRVVVAGGGMTGAETAVFLAVQGCDVTMIEMAPDIITDAVAQPRACLLEQDGETAGYGLLSLKYSHEAGGLELWVEELYVRPAFRGRGLGHEFFAWLRGLSAAEHIRRIRLETEPENERAAALYARMGFSPLGYCQMFREEAT